MQTFKLTLQLQLSAVITQQFLDEARKEAQAEDAPLFLKTMQEKFPEDDDQFMLAIVKNAMRTTVRVSTLNFMASSGVGGSVSPVQIVSEEILQPKDAVAVFAEATDPDNSAEVHIAADLRADPPVNGYSADQLALLERNPAPKAAQLRIGNETPGALINGLVQERAE